MLSSIPSNDLTEAGATAEIEDAATRAEEHTSKQNNISSMQGKGRPMPDSRIDGVEDGSIKEILRDILEALQDSSIAGPTSAKDHRSRFWGKYKRVAEEHDSEFLERYSSDMDIVLIFAGLFSAVSTSFIVAMEPSLLPDPSDTTNALLLQIAQTLGNSTTPGYVATMPTVPIFPGPSRTDVWVQTLAYLSLASSLLAAFGAVLGKQWLGYYKANRYGRGTIEERGVRRQEKFDGLQTWYFDAALQSFPLLIQCSLLLFGLALSGHMWSEQRTIADVIVATTALGALFYLFTLFASLLSPACPFQSPLSTLLRFLPLAAYRTRKFVQNFRIYSACAHQLEASRQFVRDKFSLMKAVIHHCISKVSFPRSTSEDIEKGSVQPSDNGPIKSSPRNDDSAASLSLDLPDRPSKKSVGAPSVLWLLETSTDPEVLLAASCMIPEVEWHPDLDVSSGSWQLLRIYVQSIPQGTPLSPDCYDNAIKHCRSLIYLYSEMDSQARQMDMKTYIQLCIHDLGNRLEDHLLNAFDIMFGSRVEQNDRVPKFLAIASNWEILQVLHLLPYANFEFACAEEYLQSSLRSLIFGVVSSILNRQNYLTCKSPGVADCAMVIGSLLGLKFRLKDKRKLDKSLAFEKMMNAIYVKMTAALCRDQHDIDTRKAGSCESDEHADKPAPYSANLQEHVAMDILPFLTSLLLAVLNAKDLEFLLVDGLLFVSKVYFNKSLSKSDQNLDPTKCLEDGSQDLPYLQASVRATAIALNKGDPLSYSLRSIRTTERFRVWSGRYIYPNLKSATQHHPWLLDHLKHLCATYQGDISDLQDALLASIYGLPDLQTFMKDIQCYLETIIFCIGTDKPVELRRTALRAIYAKQDILLPPDEALAFEWNALPVFADFSVALLDVVCPTGKEKDPSGPEDDSRYSNSGISDLDDCIDRYGKLISKLAQVDIWRARIIHDGHFKVFISRPTSRFFLDENAWRSLLPDFWTSLASNTDRLLDQWPDIKELLPEIIRLTLEYATPTDSIFKELPDAEARIQSMLMDKGEDPQSVAPLFDDLRENLEGRRQAASV